MIVTGVSPGRDRMDERGDKGFGYDPIFVPDGAHRGPSPRWTWTRRTVFSHRGAAMRIFVERAQGKVEGGLRMTLQGRKILVTGCAGFIGSHMVDALLAKGCEVVGVDNLSAGKMEFMEKGQASGHFEFHQDRPALGRS